MHHRTSTKLLLLAAAWTAVPLTCAVFAQDAEQSVSSSDAPLLKAVLLDPASRQDQRDSAARRLLSRPDPEARIAIRDALVNSQAPGVQLAAATALAENPTADATLVNPLFALIDPNASKATIDAAAMALSAYKSDPGVVSRLLELAKSAPDERIRLAVIRSAGTYLDKRVAQTLLNLMDPTAQPTSINSAAEEALAYMTGLSADATEPEQWQTWWKQNVDKSEVQFVADLGRSRAARYDLVRISATDLTVGLTRALQDRYSQIPADKADARRDLLLKYLRSEQASVRTVGALIAGNAALSGGVPPVVQEQLRQLIGDSNADVRRQAALALAPSNDAAALIPLLTQLNQETDPTVRAAIAQAIAPVADVRAVPALLALLDGVHTDTALAAARALGEPILGEKLTANPALAAQAAEKLIDVAEKRTQPLLNEELRYQLIRAITPLRNKSTAARLTRLLIGPSEVPKVRRALLEAVGALHDPRSADTIQRWMESNDPVIRKAAVLALGEVADSFDYEKQLRDLINPQKEPQQEVRDAAWSELVKLFAKATPQQLGFWVNQLAGKENASKRYVVLSVLREKARSKGDAEGVSLRESQMGDAAIEAGDFDEAISNYKSALVYIIANNKSYQEETVSERFTLALLRAVQYDDAVQFVQKQIVKDQKFQSLGAEIKKEAERLVEIRDYDNARRLIDKALQMKPALPERYRGELQTYIEKMRTREQERNFMNPRAPRAPQNARAD